ncbi:MAG: hypothetical protein R3F14_06280 [Polyangiaceae bacterium]
MQDALEDKLLHILGLARRRQYDDALTCLESILNANRNRDHDGWLSNSVALQRASILFDAGRYSEAEQVYNDWSRLGFVDVWRRQMHALGLSKTLEALGRDREAMAALEAVLGNDDPDDPSLTLSALTNLVRISDKLTLPLNPEWLRIAEAIAKHHGVVMPSGHAPAGAILALEELLRSKQ